LLTNQFNSPVWLDSTEMSIEVDLTAAEKGRRALHQLTCHGFQYWTG
jgi:hypothetical protein